MNKIIQKIIHPKGERGGVLVLVTLCLIILIGFVALAVDIGYMYTTRTELQRVADASALAGARYLGEIYSTLDPSQMAGYMFTPDDVKDAADNSEQNNTAAVKSIEIVRDNGDIRVGLWEVTPGDPDPDDIAIPTYTGPDAVRVIARRDNIKNGPITTFLAGLFNYDTAEIVSQKAVAALTGPSYVVPGELKTPFAISEHKFPNNCDDRIDFSPTTDSCAGWHNFGDAISGDALQAKLLGIIRGDTSGAEYGLYNGEQWLQENFGVSPSADGSDSMSTGEAIPFIGGEVSKVFNNRYLDYADYNGNTGTVLDSGPVASIRALFDYFKYRDGDGDNSIWTTTIPVYQDNPNGTCDNSNQSIPILGFAQIRIKTVNTNAGVFSPDQKLIEVEIDCNFTVIEGRGGGTTYGNLRGTIPNLVR